jgi:hypothetical protein
VVAESTKVAAQTQAVLKSTGGVAGVTAESGRSAPERGHAKKRNGKKKRPPADLVAGLVRADPVEMSCSARTSTQASWG